jgi:hypothetical protein
MPDGRTAGQWKLARSSKSLCCASTRWRCASCHMPTSSFFIFALSRAYTPQQDVEAGCGAQRAAVRPFPATTRKREEEK